MRKLKKTTSLEKIDVGQKALVIGVNIKGNLRRRLFDLGLINGTQIKCLGKSPFGDPIAFLIKDSVIAIRTEDCKNILINRI